MYTKHFGLNMLPFENVPDPVFFFDEGDYARIRNRIRESLKAGRGLIVVTGPIGSGKTTLSQMINTDFANDLRLIWMAEPPGSSTDLFLFIAQELGLNPSSTERVFVIRDIKDALLKIKSEGSKCLMIIDESHLMTDDTLDGIRLLNNLEEGSTKLIQILLLGQEELMDTINRPEMEPFRQRIAAMEVLGKMNADRIRQYISHRIQVAGGQPSMFTDTGWEAMVLAFDSGGTPRLINSLCDKSLNVAFEKGKTNIDAYDVYEATKRVGVGKEVFHYIVTLKNRERKNQGPPAEEKDSTKKISPPVKEELERETSRSDIELKHRGIKPSPILDVSDQKSLKGPIVLLLSSIIAFIVSIFFYCDRAASPDLVTCLVDLIGL